MKGFRLLATICGLALALPAVPAAAQAVQPVELKGDVKVDRIVIEEGKERHVLSSPDTVVPGDKLVFTTSYRNAGGDVVTDFIVTDPIPEAVRLSAEDAAVLELSVDGGTRWDKLANLSVDDGKGGTRPATADDVTHIRWTLAKLEPGVAGSVTYSGTVR